MKTDQPFDRAAIPRLPQAPRERFDGIVHVALGLAALAACVQFQAAIARFIPRAGTFAARLSETPEMLANPTYAIRYVDTNLAAQAAAKARPAAAVTRSESAPPAPRNPSSI